MTLLSCCAVQEQVAQMSSLKKLACALCPVQRHVGPMQYCEGLARTCVCDISENMLDY